MKEIKKHLFGYHHADFMDIARQLPDKSVGLIIADCPYFEIKGEFDFVWDSFEDYLADFEAWCKEWARILADNGSIYIYGHARRIAYQQVIADKYFTLVNNLVWFKPDCLPATKTNWEESRAYAPVTERLLFYSKGFEPEEWDKTGWERVQEEHIRPRHPMANYLREEFKRAKVTQKQIAALFPSKTGGLTGCVSNWLNGNNFITEDQYNTIREYLNGEYLRQEYEEIRQEYEHLRRPFDNSRHRLYDVLKFSQESHKTREYDHDTVKPPTITRALIEISSRPDTIVFIPFGGSGTEAEQAELLGRRWIACDTNEKYVKMGRERITKAKAFTQARTPEEIRTAGGQVSLFDALGNAGA